MPSQLYKKGEKYKMGSHFNFEQRKIIANKLAHGEKLCDIASLLEKDSTSISKEIKRNRVLTINGAPSDLVCEKTQKFPYVCSTCSKRYAKCHHNQYRYDANYAQDLADKRLVESRKGINIDKEDFEIINDIVKEGVNRKESIYHIVHANNINVSVPTLYRWIDNKLMSTTKMDLPYAVSFKKRRKQNEKYDYSSSRVDRSNRTFLDYLEFRRFNPGLFCWQMDFLGSIKTDSKYILTLIVPEIHFPLIKIFERPNQEKIRNFYDKLEKAIGTDSFSTVFPAILTDRDPCFIDYLGIEKSIYYEKNRTQIFYCDAFKSSQKGSVENMNRQLRKFFPKKKSIEHFTENQIREINIIMINTKIQSLNGFTPKEVFIKLFGEDILEELLKI